MSEGGGTGITTMAVLQSLAQARHRWGRDAAGAIWDSAIVKLILAGGSNADDLADIARLVGDRSEREISETSQAGGGTVGVVVDPPAAHPRALRHPHPHPRPRPAAAAIGQADRAHPASLDRPTRRGRRCSEIVARIEGAIRAAAADSDWPDGA